MEFCQDETAKDTTPSVTPDSLNTLESEYQCRYAAKGRVRCTRRVVDGTLYCITHRPLSGERVKCVHCKQMIKEGGMKRHLAHCSFAIADTPSYNRKGCNIIPLELDSIHRGISISRNPASTEDALRARLVDLYNQFVACELGSDPGLECPDTQYTHSTKHREQERALVECMSNKGLVGIPATGVKDSKHTYFLDFGAGKGSLSKAIGLSGRVDLDRAAFVCVERAAYKHKAENTSQMKAYRARVDIADVCLPELLRCVENKLGLGLGLGGEGGTDVVGVGKHLCGGATDLALVAMSTLCNSSSNNGSNNGSSSVELSSPPVRARGICIATCCHSNCTWGSCVARPWLSRTGQITADDFRLITHWCGMFAPSGHKPFTTTGLANEKAEPGKADLGRMCKRLIDFGRLHYVRSFLGLNGSLESYVAVSVSPENAALVAWR